MNTSNIKLPNFKLTDAPDTATGEVVGYITAKQKMEMEVEYFERRSDRAKFLIEAKMDLWDIRHPWHYFDEARDEWTKKEAEREAEKTRQAESN